MKTKLIISLLFIAIITSSHKPIEKTDTESVNPIIGDISFIEKYGYTPLANTEEKTRIQTHLEYVEKLLRKKDVSKWNYSMRQKRKKLLNLLHSYWIAGKFPKNYDYANQRKPCFIDKDGNICAVGYLIEKTAGRPVAEKISSKHKYEKIYEMKNDKDVYNWISNSGLTIEECAMIQPTYHDIYYPYPYPSNYISPAYGISSAVLGGLNLSLNTINSIQISKEQHNKTVPILGLFTGATSIVLGSANIKEYVNGYGQYKNASTRTLSFVNIGLGTTTMILSSWNLISNRTKKDKSLSWNLYNYPISANKTSLGISVTKKL